MIVYAEKSCYSMAKFHQTTRNKHLLANLSINEVISFRSQPDVIATVITGVHYKIQLSLRCVLAASDNAYGQDTGLDLNCD